VTGARNVTYWPDSGVQVTQVAPDAGIAATAFVEALVSTSAGYAEYPGTFAADGSGTFSIPNVPSGTPYLLVLVDGTGALRAWQLSADVVDLGYDVLGRPSVAFPTVTTPVTLDLSWPATEGWAGGDELEVTASNVDLWDPALSGSMLSTGVIATGPGVVEDWFASRAGGALPLLATGDGTYVHHLVSAVAAQPSPPASLPYVAAGSAAGPLTNVALSDVTGGTLSAVLGPPASTGSIDPDWRVTQFEAFLSSLGPAAFADAAPHRLVVGGAAHASAGATPAARGAPVLLRITAPAGAADVSGLGSLAWNRFLDPTVWAEQLTAEYVAHASYTLAPASIPFVETSTVGWSDAFVQSVSSTTIVPALGPALQPRVNGLDAFAAQVGVGTSPLLSWTAPLGTAPTSYRVGLYRLGVAGDGITTTSTPVGELIVSGTQLVIPPGLLAAGATYYARIEARVLALEPLAVVGAPPTASAAPTRIGGARRYASVLTAPFVP
jgi:hypothetical protein